MASLSFNFTDQLWKKEPNSDDGIFVDLFPQKYKPRFEAEYSQIPLFAKHRFLDMEFEPVKSNRVSSKLRDLGNMSFKVMEWREAMEYYSQSLRFATEGSENVGKAYWNRSACFLRLQKYDKCLNDIELARQANYPDKRKLEERETKCVEQMKDAPEMEPILEPKLSFDPDENFPCMVNILEIQCNEQFGRHIVAKCDIDVGQTLLVEEPYVASINHKKRSRCLTCKKQAMNFIPCAKCTDAMFCDEKCMQSNDNHKIGCGAAFNRLPGMTFVAETILTALNTFPSVDDLMEFVERHLITSKSELPPNCHSAQSRYEMFLKLDERLSETYLEHIQRLYFVYRNIMDIPALQNQFNTIKKQRFLMHLMWQHKLYAMNIFASALSKGSAELVYLANILSLINHSCTPNLYEQTFENKLFCTTISPIKKGEQLFITYNHDFLAPDSQKEERQNYLNEKFGFTCKCSRCVPQSRSKDSLKIHKDPSFQFILDNQYDIVYDESLKEKCYDILRKYGHLLSSDEIVFVKYFLADCLDQEKNRKF